MTCILLKLFKVPRQDGRNKGYAPVVSAIFILELGGKHSMNFLANDADIRNFFGVSPLMSTSIRLTKRCNLRCKHCYANGGENCSKEPSLKDIKNLLDQLSKLSVSEVFFTGGEPFIRKDIVDILEYANKLKLNILISSNGHFITPEVVESIKHIDFKMFQISIDGGKESHIINRGQKSWDDAERAIDCIVHGGISNTTIGSVILKDAKDYDEIINYCDKKGVSLFALMLLIEAGRAKDMIGPAGKELCEILDKLFKNYEKLNNTIEFSSNTTLPPALVPFFMREKGVHKKFACCSFPYILGIEANGDVAPCDGFFAFPEMIVGNIYDNSLEYIWENSPILKEIRKINYQDLKGVCSKCKYAEYCGGGCRASAYNKYRDLTMPDPACQQYYEEGIFPKDCLK